MRPRQEAKCNKYSTVVDDVLPFDDDKRDAIIDRSEPRSLCERIAGRVDESILYRWPDQVMRHGRRRSHNGSRGKGY